MAEPVVGLRHVAVWTVALDSSTLEETLFPAVETATPLSTATVSVADRVDGQLGELGYGAAIVAALTAPSITVLVVVLTMETQPSSVKPRPRHRHRVACILSLPLGRQLPPLVSLVIPRHAGPRLEITARTKAGQDKAPPLRPRPLPVKARQEPVSGSTSSLPLSASQTPPIP